MAQTFISVSALSEVKRVLLVVLAKAKRDASELPYTVLLVDVEADGGQVRKVGSEEELTWQLARYLQIQYPNVLYHIDFGSGTKLTMGQAVKQKQLNKRAWPDLFIAQEGDHDALAKNYNGFFLELKREGTKLYLKDGKTMVSNEHYQEQAMILKALRSQGYYAEFAVGFEDAKAQIDKYLQG